ncbi:hypothetical protein [Chitinophaga nivalis]|uniref:DNRLRE domain-containing protein n=1 Tax=Chitinophaga nivalis TaxID=2991709 RepID=A0ABT3IJN3_9BACT|nr:hypothetical protein [Chitinophaga nivalis]MCW3466156.1 hypothetical protein [Chitinophaga nivalis]MCW3484153.1 hypothetical protein [Chitinophaga nivalis]
MTTIKFDTIKKRAGIAGLALMLCLPAAQAQRYTTLLPDIAVNARTAGDGRGDAHLEVKANANGQETVRSLFKFGLGILPENARVSALQLRLYVQRKTDTLSASHQTITLLQSNTPGWKAGEAGWNYPVFDSTRKIGMFPIVASTRVANIKLAIPARPGAVTDFLKTADTSLSLAARSPQQNQDNFFYADKMESIGAQYAKKPKLLVQYAVNMYPKLADWSQLRGNSQHNGYTGWMADAWTTAATINTLYRPEKGYISGADPVGAMVVYNGNPVVFTQDPAGSAPIQVVQLDGAGKVLWRVAMPEINKFCPLIDAKGRMYCITTNRLIIFDLNNYGNKLLDVALAGLLGDEVGGVVNTPALGYDGMLYLPASNAVVALTPYPRLKTLWRYPISKDNEMAGPVSLSSSERHAFFIKVNNNYGQLMVLDNSDGTPLDSSAQRRLSTYVYDGYTRYIPAPVIADDSSILVLNGFDNSNELYCFGWAADRGRLLLRDEIIAGQTGNTGISQPVADTRGNVYFVFNNRLQRYRPADRSRVGDADEQPLDNATLLVTNDSLQVFAWDAVNNLAAGFSTSGQAMRRTFVATPGVGVALNFRKNIALAPDGTLYSVNNNYLLAVKTSKVNADLLNLQAIKNNTLYRANNLINISGTVINTTHAIISSGGGIGFQNGFTVEPGAKLSFQSGFK